MSVFSRIAMALMLVAGSPSMADPPPNGDIEWYGTARPEHPALYAPKPSETSDPRLTGTGIFELHVRRDGIVSSVVTVASTGHPKLDAAAVAGFAKWRFVPETIKKVRIAITFVDTSRSTSSR